MPTFVRTVEIKAPVETVFGFHEREDALALLAPLFPPVQLISKSPGMGIGTRVELRILLLRWIALHTAYEKHRLFVDEQIEGPFSKWVHRHEFEDLGGRTGLTERIEYSLPGGNILNALLGWAVELGLNRMFAHRHSVTRRICETS